MSTEIDKASQLGEEEQLDNLLSSTLPREEVPEEIKARLAGHLQQALNTRIVARRQSRKRQLLSLSAGVFVVALAIGSIFETVFFSYNDSQSGFARIAAFQGEVRVNGDVLLVDDYLKIGDQLVTRSSNSLVSFHYRNALVRVAGDSAVVIANDHIHLMEGKIYIDAESLAFGEQAGDRVVEVRTAHATITDIGTQFMVAVHADKTNASVREGSIIVKNSEGHLIGEATDEVARKIDVGVSGFRLYDSDLYGEEWQWIAQIPAEFELDGKTLHEYLIWVASEIGVPVMYQDETSERIANTVTLRGDLKSLSPESSLDVVMKTTSLRVDLDSASMIRVYSF